MNLRNEQFVFLKKVIWNKNWEIVKVEYVDKDEEGVEECTNFIEIGELNKLIEPG